MMRLSGACLHVQAKAVAQRVAQQAQQGVHSGGAVHLRVVFPAELQVCG